MLTKSHQILSYLIYIRQILHKDTLRCTDKRHKIIKNKIRTRNNAFFTVHCSCCAVGGRRTLCDSVGALVMWDQKLYHTAQSTQA